MDKKTHGPKPALSCESCEYHYTWVAHNVHFRNCRKTTKMLQLNGIRQMGYPSINLSGNETPTWCPLIQKANKDG